MSNPFDNFTPEPWTSEATCATHPHPDLWFAGDGINGNTAGPNTRLAIQLCGTCPVQSECLNYAMSANEHHGIWAGLTPRQRQNKRQYARRASAKNAAA